MSVCGIEYKLDADMIHLNFEKSADGLLPAIVQEHTSGQILMLAYINRVSWEKTLETGKAHYWSRSRNSLWLKGETSGNVQLVREILVDCDEDTVVTRLSKLVERPAIPVIHHVFFAG
jgi:phosphoribosyl-AMP cyclohydrolase